MRRDILLVLSMCVLLTACTPIITYDNAEAISIEDARCPPLEITSMRDVYRFVAASSYRSDAEAHGQDEYWQCPYETWERRTGDCEDWAIFLAYYARKLGKSASLVAITTVWGDSHAVAKIGGVLIDGRACSIFSPEYIRSIDDEWTVEEALGICNDIYGSK